MLAAADASVDAVAPPVVMKLVKPGRATGDPFGIRLRTISSVTRSMPTPCWGSGVSRRACQSARVAMGSGCSKRRNPSSAAPTRASKG